MLARIEDDEFVFEVSFETIEPTDVTLRFRRDGEKVGSIYNDDGTEQTMARLTTAVETGRVTDESAAEGYRLRVL